MTLGEFREQTKELSDDLVLEFYSEKYNDSTQPMRLEFDTEGYVEFVIDDDRWCLAQEPRWISVSEGLPNRFEFVNCTLHSLIDDRPDWVVETVYVPQFPNSPYSDWGNIPMLNHGDCKVVAWMYRDIPEPYKAESEKTNRWEQ